jgi:DNA-binding response OmpR family regulator
LLRLMRHGCRRPGLWGSVGHDTPVVLELELMSVRWAEDATARMPTVLVVDDEQMIRWSIEQTLSAAGYAVVTAETGAEGLALFRKLRPDVLFLDVRLPDVNGLAMLQQVKTERPQTALIVMTAFEEDSTAATAMDLGADDYLRKPFNFDELAERVRETLDRASPR